MSVPAVRQAPPPPDGSYFASKEYKDIHEHLEQLGKGPRPPVWYDNWVWEMPNAHLALIDPLQRVYCFADWAIENDDLANYLTFAEIAVLMIVEHHGTEENVVFPQWSKASGLDIWNKNVEEHHLFSDQLDSTYLYLRNCRKFLPTPSPCVTPEPNSHLASIDITKYSANLDFNKGFDPKGFKKHLDSYVGVLVKHLYDEIQTMKPENIQKIGEEEEKRIRGETMAHMAKFDPSWFMGFALSCIPIEKVCALLGVPPTFKVPATLPGAWKYCEYPENMIWDAPAPVPAAA